MFKQVPVVDDDRNTVQHFDTPTLLVVDDEAVICGACRRILKQEGFARLPRRADDERPKHPHPDRAPVADVQQLDLAPRQLRTQFGGLFLFVPYLAEIPWEAIFEDNAFPGSKIWFRLPRRSVRCWV